MEVSPKHPILHSYINVSDVQKPLNISFGMMRGFPRFALDEKDVFLGSSVDTLNDGNNTKDQPGALTKFLHAVNWVDMEESCTGCYFSGQFVRPLVTWRGGEWREWYWNDIILWCDGKFQEQNWSMNLGTSSSLGCDSECDSQQQTTGKKGLIIINRLQERSQAIELLGWSKKWWEDQPMDRVVLQNGHWFSIWVNQPTLGKMNQPGHFQPMTMGVTFSTYRVVA